MTENWSTVLPILISWPEGDFDMVGKESNFDMAGREFL